jgi:hypothetical protein
MNFKLKLRDTCPYCGAKRDTPSADFVRIQDLVRIQEHWPSFTFYPLDGYWFIENVDIDGKTILHTVSADTPEEAVKAALKEIENA